MSAGAGAHQDQPVDARFRRLACVAHVDHVVEHDAAVGMDGATTSRGALQAGDDDRHLVAHADLEVVLQPVVGLVHDLVDREGRYSRARVSRPRRAARRDAAATARAAPRAARSAPGNPPTMPALHCAMTRSGSETMNIGAPITGSERRSCRREGSGMELDLGSRSGTRIGDQAGRGGGLPGCGRPRRPDHHQLGQVLGADVADQTLLAGRPRRRGAGRGAAALEDVVETGVLRHRRHIRASMISRPASAPPVSLQRRRSGPRGSACRAARRRRPRPETPAAWCAAAARRHRRPSTHGLQRLIRGDHGVRRPDSRACSRGPARSRPRRWRRGR